MPGPREIGGQTPTKLDSVAVRPSDLSVSGPIGISVLLWIILACVFLVLPVALRFLAGDDLPDNSVTQEQDGSKDRDPAQMRLAA